MRHPTRHPKQDIVNQKTSLTVFHQTSLVLASPKTRHGQTRLVFSQTSLAFFKTRHETRHATSLVFLKSDVLFWVAREATVWEDALLPQFIRELEESDTQMEDVD